MLNHCIANSTIKTHLIIKYYYENNFTG